MKKILLISIILSGLCALNPLYAEDLTEWDFLPEVGRSSILLESEYQSFFGNICLLNNYQYNYNLPNNWFFSHSGGINQSRNRRFHRYSRNADLIWELRKSYDQVEYTLHMDYIAGIDKARPDLESYEIGKTRRQAGLDVEYSPMDSLFFLSGITYIRSDDTNTRFSEGTIGSNGYRSYNNVRFSREFNSALLGFDTFFNIMNLDYDYARSYGALVNFDLLNPIIDTELSFRRDTNKIYLLNDEVDTHIRSVYRASVVYSTSFSDDIFFHIGDNFQARDNRLQESRERNFIELDNSLFTNAEYFWYSFRFFGGAEYRLFSRSFKADLSSREQEQRIFLSGLSYHFSESDSLILSRNINLTRTDYTISSSVLDNDQLTIENQVSLYTSLRQNIRFINHFNFTTREEGYLKSGMSANNKTTRIYNLLPSLNIAINRNVLLQQEYHLRADYDDFTFEDAIRDRMYRRFSATYSILSGLPWVRESSKYIPDRDYYYFFYDVLLGVSYTYDTNSSGNRIGDAYEIFAENEYHTLQFELFRRIDRVEFRVRPRFIWSNIRNEVNHLFEFTYILPDRRNFVSISTNCTGRGINDLLWRVNAMVYMAF